MKEGMPGNHSSMEKYLRREDTVLAKALNSICSLQGEEYRNSKFKRRLEFVLTLPAAFLSIPVTAMLGVAAKFEDGGTAFFIQERVGKNGEPVNVVKVRAMKMNSPVGPDRYTGEPENDPRNTQLGKKMRGFELEELPQLLQILKGDLSLVDIRAMPQYAIDNLEKKKPENFEAWHEAYQEGKPGLLNLNSALNPDRKDDSTKMHYDMLYAKKASLGLDLYIIFKTSGRLINKLRKNKEEQAQLITEEE